MTGRIPRVFSIPPGAVFLDTLADALLDGVIVPGFSRADAPLGLAAATIYVPTRRSARALAAVLAQALGGPAALLPRIIPLGALDDSELLFEDDGLENAFDSALPAAIGDIARRMILTRLILAWGKAVGHAIVSVDGAGRRSLAGDEPLLVSTSPADAWHLSGDLARLIDEFALEGVAWSRMDGLGTEAFDHYWRITLDFLDIAMTRYPEILAARGEVDRATRQVRLIEAEAARLAAGRHAGPVIVAGSTGSSSATARLIAAVARLPDGAVVLPGLDRHLDPNAWDLIGGAEAAETAAGHPQHALRQLLAAIGLPREAVTDLGTIAPGRAGRGKLVAEALRPAETTEHWRSLEALDRHAALDGVVVIEAADEREEALAIAIALREALERPGTAALVTPDREIARRVREELMRWDIDIEESSGEPLGQTQAGTLARFVLDCIGQDLAPVEVLALLRHPDVRLGMARREILRLTRRLEEAVLRGVLPARALHDPATLVGRLRAAATAPHASPALRSLREADFTELEAFLDELLAALAPLRDCLASAPLPRWLEAHEAALAALLSDQDGEAAPDGPGYPVLSGLFEELATAADPAILLQASDYAALFDRLAAETPVRGPNRSHPRIKILGLLEARLLDVGRIILAGLDETIWPPQVRTDPFLNRPMRAALGLTPPERRIGRTAHDFEMALGHAEVIMTRALKRGGAPTVPSRFLQRLAAVSGPAWAACVARGTTRLDLTRALDRPAAIHPIARPAPKPEVRLRPTTLSVTRIEVLRRDPYAIHAERILRLAPPERIAAPVGPREIGTAFHAAIASHATADTRDDATVAVQLLDALAEPLREPAFRAFAWPRIERWTKAYLAWDAARRGTAPRMLIEAKGRLSLRLADGSSFDLTAEADRIEIDAQGGIALVDFKTGLSPSLREVKAGFAPQLTLEALMAAEGAFASLGGGRVVEAVYVKFGSSEEARTIRLDWKGDPAFEDVVATHRDELAGLLDAFRRVETGYVARPFPKYASRFGAYDHLSRVKEWSATGGEGDGAEGGEG
ncbi:MAG TPA: double-strand break repair protein AddB [Lichenihabitans sp.]|nr:double-strand break repair protein AddB [Lichenihabitans sp.]